jgi:alpha-1,3-rhamnosyltransferase
MMPLVSVIMASHNHAPYVTESIMSIVNQSYANMEMIVIDDGSADSSPRILSELSAQYGFRLILQGNSGIARTFNLGISLAKGKYICLTSSDDVWTRGKIGRQVEYMENHPGIAVCGGIAKLMNEKSEVADINWLVRPKVLTFNDIFVSGERLPAFTAMIRRTVLKEVGLYDPELSVEDLYMWLKIAHKGYKIVVLDDVLGYYRVHQTNIHRNVKLMIESVERILLRYKNEPYYESALNRYYLRQFCVLAPQNKKAALEFLRKYRFGILDARMFLISLMLFLVPIKTYALIKRHVFRKKA